MAGSSSTRRCLAAGAIGLAMTATPPAAAAMAGGSGAEVEPTPPTARAAAFNAASFTAPDDGWAVGTIGESLSGSGVDTLIEHWNGTAWELVPTPAIMVSNEYLTGVVAFGSDDAWAVGRQDRYGYSADLPMLFRWDGLKWSTVTAPGPAIPSAIGGSGPDDVWAVGRNVLQHFDGTAWISVTPPRADASLNSVTVLSPDDAWVGGTVPDRRSGYDRTAHPFLAHWDGTSWSRVGVPHPRTDARVASVSASSSSDVWAVGSAAASTTERGGTFALHFDGTRWHRVKSPNRGAENALSGVVTASATEAWAVGHRDGYTRAGSAVWRTLIERWDGTRWEVVASPNDSDLDNYLTSVAIGDGITWALGGDGGTLAERIDR